MAKTCEEYVLKKLEELEKELEETKNELAQRNGQLCDLKMEYKDLEEKLDLAKEFANTFEIRDDDRGFVSIYVGESFFTTLFKKGAQIGEEKEILAKFLKEYKENEQVSIKSES